MASNGSGKTHFQRRGGKVNKIQKSKRELRIRLVYPPYRSSSPQPADQPFKVTGLPAKNMDYILKADDEEYANTTDDNGVLCEVLPIDVTSVRLTLYAKVKGVNQPFWKLNLVISDLDGCEPILGAKARLNNLGLFASETLDLSENAIAALNEGDDLYVRALERFRNLFGPALDPNRAFDEKAEWARIKEIHGS